MSGDTTLRIELGNECNSSYKDTNYILFTIAMDICK